jgi:hypothetical protein
MMARVTRKMLLINFLLLPRLLPRSSTISHVEIYASAICWKTKKKYEAGLFGIDWNDVGCHESMALRRFSLFQGFFDKPGSGGDIELGGLSDAHKWGLRMAVFWMNDFFSGVWTVWMDVQELRVMNRVWCYGVPVMMIRREVGESSMSLERSRLRFGVVLHWRLGCRRSTGAVAGWKEVGKSHQRGVGAVRGWFG